MAIKVLKAGDTSKPDPFTICIIANPVLERPIDSGLFVRDPILTNEQAYNMSVRNISGTLFGRLPNQRENIFADPLMATALRIVSIFDATLPVLGINAMVAEAREPRRLEPRRMAIKLFLQRMGIGADVAFAVTASPTHNRASSHYTTDDDNSPGVPFTVDGRTFHHRFRSLVPGTIAIHALAQSLSPLHEFQHAISSFTNCVLVDLHFDNFDVDNGVLALNNKRARPIPQKFVTYNGATLPSDFRRDSLGYGPGWQSYHCEHISPTDLTIMDAYPKTLPPTPPEACQNDVVTRRFVIDRIRAKMSR